MSEPKMPWDDIHSAMESESPTVWNYKAAFWAWFTDQIQSHPDAMAEFALSLDEMDTMDQLAILDVAQGLVRFGYKQGQEIQQARITELERLLQESQVDQSRLHFLIQEFSWGTALHADGTYHFRFGALPGRHKTTNDAIDAALNAGKGE